MLIFGSRDEGYQLDVDSTMEYLQAAGISGLTGNDSIVGCEGSLDKLSGTAMAYRGTPMQCKVTFAVFCRDNGVFVDWETFKAGSRRLLVKIHPTSD